MKVLRGTIVHGKGMKLDEIGSFPRNLRGRNEQKTDLKSHQIDFQMQSIDCFDWNHKSLSTLLIFPKWWLKNGDFTMIKFLKINLKLKQQKDII